MTAEKMTLAEALEVATHVLGAKDRSEHKQEAAAVLREFRERGLPFFEAAEKIGQYMRQHNLEGFTTPLGGLCFQDFATTYRRWKEGE